MPRFDATRYDADRHAEHADALSRLVEAIEQRVPEGLVIDIGCGTGALLARLPEHERIGIDIDPLMLSAARQHIPDVPLLAGSATSPPSGLPLADLVVMRLVLHLTDSVEAAVSSAARMLTPGGHLVIETLDPGQVGRSWLGVVDGYDGLERQRLPDETRLRAAATAAGLSVLDVECVHEHEHIEREEAIERLRRRSYSTLHLLPDVAIERAVQRLQASDEPLDSSRAWLTVWARA